jgi:hypothetical protein
VVSAVAAEAALEIAVVGPGLGRAASRHDPLTPAGSGVLTARLLPGGGPFFAEVTLAADAPGDGPDALEFFLAVDRCSPVPVVGGSLTPGGGSGRCALGDGRHLDVWAVTGASLAAPAVTSIDPGDGCALGVFPGGALVPENGCLGVPLELPLLDSRAHLWIVAVAPEAEGAVEIGRCNLPTVGAPGVAFGVVSPETCQGPEGLESARVLIEGAARRVRFGAALTGDGLRGNLVTAPGHLAILAGVGAPRVVAGRFGLGAEALIPTAGRLAGLIRVLPPVAGGGRGFHLGVAPLRERR